MIVLEQISVTSTEYAPHSGYHSWPLLFLWRLNWSLLAYLLSHCKHSYGLSPLCSLAVVWWRVRSLRRVKPLVHPSSLQTNLRSAFLVPLPVPFLVCLRRRRVHPSCQSSSDESSRSDVYSGRRLSFLGRFLVDWDDDRPAITSFPEVVTDCRDGQFKFQFKFQAIAHLFQPFGLPLPHRICTRLRRHFPIHPVCLFRPHLCTHPLATRHHVALGRPYHSRTR